MDHYVYLFLSLAFLLVWVLIYLLRKDLRKTLLLVSFVGLFTGPITELWDFQDYWHPLTFIGTIPIIEDALFGFSIIGISVTIYDVLMNNKVSHEPKIKKKSFAFTLIFLFFLFLFIFSTLLKINSILVSYFTFFILTIYILIKNPKLIMRSLISGIAFLFIAIVIYCILFNIYFPDYWRLHWLLAKTPYGIFVLGNIPLSELIWYFTLGCLTGIGYTYVTENT